MSGGTVQARLPETGGRDPWRFGEAALRAAAAEALGSAIGRGGAPGAEAEVLVLARREALTRFANSAIHQNVAAAGAQVRVRVARGRRLAAVWTTRLDPEGLRHAASEAAELARVVPEDPDWPGFPAPAPAPAAPGFVEATAAAAPEARAAGAAVVCGAARAAGLRAAGFVATAVEEVAVASSRGVWAYHAGTVAEAQAVVLGADGSGFADRVHADVGALAVEELAEEAVATARRAQGPRAVPPDTYEVVLGPYAVADLVGFLGSQLTGLAVEEGRSFVGGRLGTPVTGAAVTLVDDPLDPAGLPRPFDFEGVPTEPLTLVERGVARAVVYDSRTAARHGVRNTGHALPGAAPAPLPTHLRLEPGSASREALVAGVRRGLYVTRFWYTRWVHPLRTVVTGMTRDGTFLIERGELAYPVRDLRFTQSYHEALGGLVALEDRLTLQRLDLWDLGAGHLRVPTVRLAAFRFTGATAG